MPLLAGGVPSARSCSSSRTTGASTAKACGWSRGWRSSARCSSRTPGSSARRSWPPRSATELGELLDTVLANSPAATAILDADLRVLNANAAFAELGSAEVGTHLADALADLAGRVVPIAQTVLDEGRAVDRAMVRSRPGPDGRRYWQVTAFPVDHVAGGRLGVGLVLTEVTEERRSARRLTDSLARLDLSLAAGGLGSWDWDFLRNEVVWSGTLADVLGVDPNAFTSDPYAFTEIIHPDDRQEHRDKIVAAAQAGEDFQNEVRVVRMDGEERWLEVRGRTVDRRPRPADQDDRHRRGRHRAPPRRGRAGPPPRAGAPVAHRGRGGPRAAGGAVRGQPRS